MNAAGMLYVVMIGAFVFDPGHHSIAVVGVVPADTAAAATINSHGNNNITLSKFHFIRSSFWNFFECVCGTVVRLKFRFHEIFFPSGGN